MNSMVARQLIHENSNARQRILDFAEKLFMERGLQVTVRQLAAKAKVSFASINYYFGSKAGLTQAVFERLSHEVNVRRLADLDAILQAAREKNDKPRMPDLISAFLRPYFDDKGRLLAKIIVMHRLEPSPLTHLIIDRHFGPMALRFVEAFALACPDVNRAAFAWRYSFMINAIVLTFVNTEASFTEKVSKGRVNSRDPKRLSEELTRFLAGGMSVPA